MIIHIAYFVNTFSSTMRTFFLDYLLLTWYFHNKEVVKINERIKELRKALGLTSEKFGSNLGVGKTAISGIETGRRNVTDQMFLAICREYDVNPDWLRTGEGEMFSEDDEEYLFRWVGRVLKDKPESFKKRTLNLLSSLDDSDWQALEKIFQKIKED